MNLLPMYTKPFLNQPLPYLALNQLPIPPDNIFLGEWRSFVRLQLARSLPPYLARLMQELIYKPLTFTHLSNSLSPASINLFTLPIPCYSLPICPLPKFMYSLGTLVVLSLTLSRPSRPPPGWIRASQEKFKTLIVPVIPRHRQTRPASPSAAKRTFTTRRWTDHGTMQRQA